MLRASISATKLICPSPGLEPSRLMKLRVVWRMEKAPLAGVSPAPKQGPQKASRSITPLSTRSAATPLRLMASVTGWLPG